MDKRERTQWRFAFASALGSSHEKTGSPCQDASACTWTAHADASLLVAVVADGAGSARLSQYGSRLACMVVHDEVRAFLDRGMRFEDIDRAFAERTLRRFQARVQRIARRTGNTPRDFACTLLAALIGVDHCVFFQVGDGAIVTSPSIDPLRSQYAYDWVFWPQQGEYANQTNFITAPDARDNLTFVSSKTRIVELALFSDGLQNLVLDYGQETAHEGFFKPMFRTVRKAQPGHSTSLSSQLSSYLASRSITSRTDDDKSLVLATRWGLAEPAPALPQPVQPEQNTTRTDVLHGHYLRHGNENSAV